MKTLRILLACSMMLALLASATLGVSAAAAISFDADYDGHYSAPKDEGGSAAGNPSGSTGTASTSPSTTGGSSEIDLETLKADFIRLLNEERAAIGADPVIRMDEMDAVAQLRAAELVTSYSHTRPNGDTPSSAARELGVSYNSFGECIGCVDSSVDAQALIISWMQSESHREIMLREKYTMIGIGAYQDQHLVYYTLLLYN